MWIIAQIKEKQEGKITQRVEPRPGDRSKKPKGITPRP